MEGNCAGEGELNENLENGIYLLKVETDNNLIILNTTTRYETNHTPDNRKDTGLSRANMKYTNR